MKKEPLYLSVCTPKGGMGKTTFTILLASILHYSKGLNTLVVDADYPQWSIHQQRERELEILNNSNYYKAQIIRQHDRTGQKIFPLLSAKPNTAIQTAGEFNALVDRPLDLVMFDFPGTLNAEGMISAISNLDYLFIPMKADRLVMETTLNFARLFDEMKTQGKTRLKGIYLFWTMIDRRERTVLFDQYEKILDILKLAKLDTHIPLRLKFNKELQPGGGPAYRSTLFPPGKEFMQDAMLGALADEICSIIKIG